MTRPDLPPAPVRVGLVGAGPWAALAHAPLLASDARIVLSGIWARRPEAAAGLAAAHRTVAAPTFDALLEGCDAVAFAVPPDVQAALAVRAARAGKALLLEKPVALDVDAAEALADAVGETGVTSQLALSWRYAPAMRSLLAEVQGVEAVGGRGHFLSGALLGGLFATPWRLEHGALLDLGPHVVDALDAALGEVIGVRAHGGDRWVGLLLEHRSGASSEVSLSGHAGLSPHRAGLEIHTVAGVVEVDAVASIGVEAAANLVGEFVATARGVPHPLDVHRGVHLQRVLTEATRQLRS